MILRIGKLPRKCAAKNSGHAFANMGTDCSRARRLSLLCYNTYFQSFSVKIYRLQPQHLNLTDVQN